MAREQRPILDEVHPRMLVLLALRLQCEGPMILEAGNQKQEFLEAALWPLKHQQVPLHQVQLGC